jgi:sodium transport system ATP-binding protein
MVHIEDLDKSFRLKRGRGQKQALAGVSLRAEPGRIYGLLGPNGAGKTTLLRCVATLLAPDRGTITVCGRSTRTDAQAVRGLVGLLTSDMKLSGNLTPRELLTFFGELNHLERPQIRSRIDQLTGELGLGPFLDLPVEKCSTGQKQRASLAVSLVHDPEVILFDEPTNGLDLFAAKAVVDFLREFRARGKTILLSTHILSEAETLCDTVGILLDGRLAAEGSVADLQSRTGTTTLDRAFFALATEQGAPIDA